MITFEDFKKIELRVGKVLEAARVEGADKLLELKVDIGSETRQLVAGIAQHYEPSALIGRHIVVVANLEPRVIKGLESQGMLLAANCEDKPVLLMPDADVPPGTAIM